MNLAREQESLATPVKRYKVIYSAPTQTTHMKFFSLFSEMVVKFGQLL
jgi:hypothetical protein